MIGEFSLFWGNLGTQQDERMEIICILLISSFLFPFIQMNRGKSVAAAPFVEHIPWTPCKKSIRGMPR